MRLIGINWGVDNVDDAVESEQSSLEGKAAYNSEADGDPQRLSLHPHLSVLWHRRVTGTLGRLKANLSLNAKFKCEQYIVGSILDIY